LDEKNALNVYYLEEGQRKLGIRL